MTDKSHSHSTPTPEQLREQVEVTRDKLGQTVEALAGKADVKAQAQQKAAKVKSQVQDKAAHALQVAQDKTPEPVRRAGHAVGRGHGNQVLLITGGVAALGVFIFMRRSRRC
ncbi:DUF3618 domain-containing protein [Streptomyces sp. ISL-1]|uniref:DUF3618 domain-containing protein n=1 Tax=Streptomyces sp. ISL-1 TaxID=2817657 RepID=UPI001BE66A2B|nr:DUF3618 domain-containing protein [Streptomyces sp. ISL-1]MBT2392012.1 DUF3618 domain-containing protein [Streptomyces sp. ISL-1]